MEGRNRWEYQMREAIAQQQTTICLVLFAEDGVSCFNAGPIMHERPRKRKAIARERYTLSGDLSPSCRSGASKVEA